jgi:hypothetical protein
VDVRVDKELMKYGIDIPLNTSYMRGPQKFSIYVLCDELKKSIFLQFNHHLTFLEMKLA